MPTAGRLTGAIVFALLGAYFGYTALPYFPESGAPSTFLPLCVVAGIWSGWVVVGKRAGLGYKAGMANGITGTVAMAFWILFLLSFQEMIGKSMRRAYDGPVEALVGVFELMAEYIVDFAQSELAIILAVGAIVCGFLTDYVAQRYP